MAAQIRQEINILDHNIAAAAADTTSNEIAQLDTTKYNGTVTYYFEVLCSKTAGDSVTIALRRSGTSTDDATIASASIPTTLGLVRSAAFTPPAGATEYRVFVDYTSGTGAVVKAARIIVIQSATTLTNTETQVEVGNYNLTRTTESAAILTNPKYWKYTAANWDGTKTFYAEAVYDSGDMDTISVYLYESAAIDAPSWSSVATIVSAATTTTPTRTRVTFTPTDGRWYTIFSLNGSMDNHDIYRAGVVVQQAGSTTTATYYFNASDAGPTDTNGAWLNDGNAFDGSTSTSSTTTTTDATSTLTGTGTTAPTTGEKIVQVRFRTYGSRTGTGGEFLGAKVYSSGVENGSVNNQNNPADWSSYDILSVPSGGWTWQLVNDLEIRFRSSVAGGTINAYRGEVEVTYYDLVTNITKLEPQYLLANTLFAAGTALQTFLTDWDSTEWDDGAGSITYYFQAEAANGSTSDVTLEEADGGGTVTNSTLTNIDNAQISSAMTMPADQNLDTKATTNAGDVAAARILVAYVFAAAAAVPATDSAIRRVSPGFRR